MSQAPERKPDAPPPTDKARLDWLETHAGGALRPLRAVVDGLMALAQNRAAPAPILERDTGVESLLGRVYEAGNRYLVGPPGGTRRSVYRQITESRILTPRELAASIEASDLADQLRIPLAGARLPVLGGFLGDGHAERRVAVEEADGWLQVKIFHAELTEAQARVYDGALARHENLDERDVQAEADAQDQGAGGGGRLTDEQWRQVGRAGQRAIDRLCALRANWGLGMRLTVSGDALELWTSERANVSACLLTVDRNCPRKAARSLGQVPDQYRPVAEGMVKTVVGAAQRLAGPGRARPPQGSAPLQSGAAQAAPELAGQAGSEDDPPSYLQAKPPLAAQEEEAPGMSL